MEKLREIIAQAQSVSVILAQKAARLMGSSRSRLLVIALVLPFLMVFAAFGFAPNTIPSKLAVTQVIQDLELPPPPSGAVPEPGYWHEERIQRGDRAATLLRRLGASDADVKAFIRATLSARMLRQLIPGRSVRAYLTADGKLLEFRYQNDGEVLQAKRDGDAFRLSEGKVELDRRVLVASGEIDTSLFGATDAAQLPDSVAIQIADVFATDVDFHRDLRRGDRFAVVYEVLYDQGEPVETGRILAAEFVNDGKAYRALWFEYAKGQGGYYTPYGTNIRKAFLRSPLEFSRITSGYTNRRYHPILQEWRAHTGVDYGAPVGTRVRATGDGVVRFSGWQGGYGNLVVLRHQSQYTTWYGHLSRFANGLRAGKRVLQGETIGYVGMTGLATGPHLHYEFRINDVHRNPLKVVLPPAPPIHAAQRPAFDAAAAPLVELLDTLRATYLARLD
jgi:murein DD-endopeptidase MepM/ murein hydrolase activator NlpD